MNSSWHLVVRPWGARFAGRRFACALGRNGIGLKTREGDGFTPQGSYRIRQLWSRHDRGFFCGRRIGPADRWCDDATAPFYNSNFQAVWPEVSSERLMRPDPLYDLIAVLDFNSERTPARGSAIFLHVWRKPRYPTEGCIAFAKADLGWILSRWKAQSRVIIQP